MPYPARLNPHLEEAHGSTPRPGPARWGCSEGSGIWEEHDLDSHDYALLCAYTHPDASGRGAGPGHGLVRLGVLLRRPLPGGLQAQPGHGGRQGVPGPAAGRSCRWTSRQTLPSRPIRSRRAWPICGRGPCPRMSHGLAARGSARAPEPARRVALGALQYQRGPGRQPDRVHRDAPQGRRRALVGRTWWSTRRAPRSRRDRRPAGRCGCCKDTFSDGVHLRNDLFSYQREIEEEGELANGVLVLETLPRLHHPAGRGPVNDLLTSRLQQFENTALTELGPALRGERAGPGGAGARCSHTSRGSRTGSRAVTSGTCAPAAT